LELVISFAHQAMEYMKLEPASHMQLSQTMYYVVLYVQPSFVEVVSYSLSFIYLYYYVVLYVQPSFVEVVSYSLSFNLRSYSCLLVYKQMYYIYMRSDKYLFLCRIRPQFFSNDFHFRICLPVLFPILLRQAENKNDKACFCLFMFRFQP
jgi:hypothetical protein